MKKRDEVREPLVEFCRRHTGKTVYVGGMWTGDFVGAVVSHCFLEAQAVGDIELR